MSFATHSKILTEKPTFCVWEHIFDEQWVSQSHRIVEFGHQLLRPSRSLPCLGGCLGLYPDSFGVSPGMESQQSWWAKQLFSGKHIPLCLQCHALVYRDYYAGLKNNIYRYISFLWEEYFAVHHRSGETLEILAERSFPEEFKYIFRNNS